MKLLNLTDHDSIFKAALEIQADYDKAYANQRFALARCLAIKLKDFQENLEKKQDKTASDLRRLGNLKDVLE